MDLATLAPVAGSTCIRPMALAGERARGVKVPLRPQPLHHRQHGGTGQATGLPVATGDLADAGRRMFIDVLQQGQLLVPDGLATHDTTPLTTCVVTVSL